MRPYFWIFALIFMGAIKNHKNNQLYSQFNRSKGFPFKKQLQKYVNSQEATEQSKKFSLVLLIGEFDRDSKEKKDLLKQLFLLHVFTPSGMHCSLVLAPVFWFIKKRRWRLLLLALIGGFLFYLPGLQALKRGWLFLFFLKGIGLSPWVTFVTTISIDLLFWTYSSAEYSFCLSFIFYAILIAQSEQSLFHKILSWGKANMMLTLFFEQQFNFFAFLLGQILTVFYSLFFPLHFFSLPIPFLFSKSLFLLDLLLQLTWSAIDWTIPASAFHLTTELFFLIILFRRKLRIWWPILFLCLPWGKISEEKWKKCSPPTIYKESSFSSCQTFPKI